MPEGIERIREIVKKHERAQSYEPLKICDLIRALQEYDELKERYDDIKEQNV